MRDILEKDSKNDSANQVLALLNDTEVETEVKCIKSYYIPFGKLILELENRSTTLDRAVSKIHEMNYQYNNNLEIPDAFKDRFDEIFERNLGFQEILRLKEHGEVTSNFLNMNEDERQLVLNGPGASSEAERSFSTVNTVLRPNRNRFKIGSFCMHIVINKYINSVEKVNIKSNFKMQFYQ